LVGFYDPNQENADKISKEFGYKHFSCHSYTCSGCNRYCNSTLSHYKCAKLPSNQANTFYRKPISNTIEEAEEIITLANEYMLKDKWDMWNDLILLLSQLKT
jgi:hypothetical protein